MLNTRLLTIFQLARRLNLPLRWIDAEAKAGRIPALKVGRHFLFNGEAVERVLLERAAQVPQAVDHE